MFKKVIYLILECNAILITDIFIKDIKINNTCNYINYKLINKIIKNLYNNNYVFELINNPEKYKSYIKTVIYYTNKNKIDKIINKELNN